MKTRVPLCRFDDVGDSTACVAETGGVRKAFMVVRQADRVFVYVNSCPHIGSPLDFRPDQFLNLEKTHILCSTHGGRPVPHRRRVLRIGPLRRCLSGGR